MGMFLIGVIVFTLLFLPFIGAAINQKKRNGQLLESLVSLAVSQECKITKHEIRGNIIIGLDENQNMAFFYKQLKNKTIDGFVNLNEMSRCKMNIVRKIGNSHIADVQTLSLVFSPKDKTKTELVWELFNSNESAHIIGELQLAKTWEEVFNKLLK